MDFSLDLVRTFWPTLADQILVLKTPLGLAHNLHLA